MLPGCIELWEASPGSCVVSLAVPPDSGHTDPSVHKALASGHTDLSVHKALAELDGDHLSTSTLLSYSIGTLL